MAHVTPPFQVTPFYGNKIAFPKCAQQNIFRPTRYFVVGSQKQSDFSPSFPNKCSVLPNTFSV